MFSGGDAPGGSGVVGVALSAETLAPDSRVVRELRRASDSLRAQHLWDAIRAVRAQKQIPAIPRMARYMTRHHGLTKDATQRLLDLAVEDNLIKLETKVGTKGNKSGVEEKAYRLPTPDMLPRERHDWYCFHCHTGGEVVLCTGCHRVYHETCLKEPLSEVNEFYCTICKIMQKAPEATTNKRERRDLNHLLSLCVKKLREKMPGNLLARESPGLGGTGPKSIFDTSDRTAQLQQVKVKQEAMQGSSSASASASPDKKPEPEDDTWRSKFLLKEQIDFDAMQHKCDSNQYRIVEEFRADAQLIVHNTVIYHGVHSNMADVARQMFRDCTYDLKDIAQCRDCYRYATENPDKYWFCKPCRPFHELVYAKQKGFPYWPAKVIRIMGADKPDGGSYDVRFFGGYHQRALVERHHIRPISVNIHSLQVKRTSLWNKACEELRKHQEFLAKVKSKPDFLKDPFGDPFASEDLKSLASGGDFDNDNASDATGPVEEDEYDEELEQLSKSAMEIDEQLTAPPPPPPSGPPLESGSSKGKKKRPGRPKKIKKDSEEKEENLVSSSSQEPRFANVAIQTPSKLMKNAESSSTKATEKEFRQYAEKMRTDFDQEKKRAVNVATRSLERDLERLKADHATELEELVEKHKQEMAEVKKKQWCYNCEAEAIYWCCWNTAYCTIECQQDHWHKEHKRMCRRKR